VKPDAEKHLRRAKDCIRVAGEMARLGFWPETVSRSYYAMFHAAISVLLEQGIERSSHHGVWAAFGQFVTAKGLMDVRFHHAGLEWFAARNDSDYFAEPGDTQEDAEDALAMAREFVTACRDFLEAREP
jgi:uncharacterized protein (UPF0332 family)